MAGRISSFFFSIPQEQTNPIEMFSSCQDPVKDIQQAAQKIRDRGS
jgi:hypothetical protein